MKYCCMFAGQGAQTPGMGLDFAQSNAELMELFDKANAVLGFDLKKTCFEGPAEELVKSNICQPAIFVTSFAAYKAFTEKAKIEFSCAAGLSLGEWGALCAAGVLDFDETLKVLAARGAFMQMACEETKSGMLALVGASEAQIEELCAKSSCTVANINSPSQVVLSGSAEAIASAATLAKSIGIKRAIPLATAGAFHSPFMQSAKERLAAVLDTVTFKPPRMSVLSNITGEPHSSDPGQIKALMLEQVVGTTNWAKDISCAKALGCDTFIEFGPGKVLSTLVKKNDPALAAFNVSDLASLDESLAALAK